MAHPPVQSVGTLPIDPPIQRHLTAHSEPAEPPGAAERPTRRARLDRWLSVLCGLIILPPMGIGVSRVPIRFDDEGTYVSQALAVLGGHLAPYTYWYDHPPLGWILIAGWMAGPGAMLPAANPITTARYLMVVVAGVTTAVLFLIARRLRRSRAAAATAALLFGLSPLSIQFHRMVLLDNLAVLFLLSAFAAALATQRKLTHAALCGVLLAFALLCKETLLLLVPFVVWTLWRQWRSVQTRAMGMTVFGVSFGIPLAYYLIFALIKGELLPGPDHVSLVEAIRFQLLTREGSGSVLDPNSDAHAVVSGWLATDWYLLAAGAVTAPLLARRRIQWPLLAMTVVAAVTLLRTGYLPVPYVITLLPFAALSVAIAVDEVVGFVRRGLRADRPTAHRVIAATAAAALVAAGLVVLPRPVTRSVERVRVYMTNDFDQPYRRATEWVAAHVPHDEVVVADNVVWTDLVNRDGRAQQTVVWFTKIGPDPEVGRYVQTWRDIDVVVMSDIMRTGQRDPLLEEALAHAVVVESWGAGPQLVEVMRVRHDG